MKKRLIGSVVAAVAGLSLTTVAAATPGPAGAAALSRARVVAHFDLAKGQMPENAVIEPNGSVDVTFAAARQVARIDRHGATRVLATLPAPSDGGVHTPVLGFALTTGLVRADDGTLSFLYATGTADLTGLWRLKPGHTTPERIAALPADGLPNGLAFDPRSRAFYITDSVLGTIWSVPANGGRATAWSTAPQLAAQGFLGANGARVHEDALWVTNLDQGTVMSLPLCGHGAGTPTVRARGLEGIDDFAFTGRGDEILAALNGPGKVVRIAADGTSTTVLDASDGLQNPTSVAVRGKDVYVPSAAYVTAADPNLLHARLPGHGR
ncbi:SMP-30/gluconolactonase/LRE family protein [Streptomyces sp. NPDC102395]|uniref:SMP-30/gluconolactonase/LRE family protein n=1 Tax=Streptomyces sp. NPDC102395 TaxID=3366168 RepID=UPI0037F3856C